VITLPAPSPGFIGDGHTAIHVIDARDFGANDPFIMLADDRVDLAPGQPAGGPHPHGGFEIVTFVVEGELRDRDEGVLRTGDVLWMTAGSGVVHNEDVEPLGKVRILQLWVKLPSALRLEAPKFVHVQRDQAQVRREAGLEARVYGGASGGVDAPSHLYLPMTMVDVQLDPDAVFTQELPPSYNGFLYPLEGDVLVHGTELRRLSVGQIGWLDSGATSPRVRLSAGARGARVMFYAGERQDVPIVTHGPFVGESRADLVRLSQAYLDHRMPRVSDLKKRV
jgi:redox-sensitive bicupin YhaK (pirin superfamily)